MVCTLMTDRKCLVSIGYNSYLVNGVMYFSILICFKLDLVILCFFDSVFLRFLGTRWLICISGAILIQTHVFMQNPLIIRSMLQVECVFFALCSLTIAYQVLVCLPRCRMGPVDKSHKICKMVLTCLHDFYGS